MQIAELLNKGMLNLYQLANKEDDKYVLLVCAGAQNFLINLTKEKGAGAIAYIPTSTTVEEYRYLSEIVKETFENGVYSGMYSYTPIRADLDPSKVELKVIGFIKPKNGNKAEDSEARMTALGYDLSALNVSLGNSNRRDYTDVMAKFPDAKARYDESHAEIIALNAKFEDLSDEFKEVAIDIENGDSIGAIIAGPTGVGKSYGVKIIADKMGAPCITLGINYGTSVDDLLGQFIPNDGEDGRADAQAQIQKILKDMNKMPVIDKNDEDKVAKLAEQSQQVQEMLSQISNLVSSTGGTAKWTFKPGPLTLAYTEGFCLVLEEVNFGAPGVLALLNTATDFNQYMPLNGKMIKRHKNFVVFMTMNPGYKGTDPLNSALKNRFSVVSVEKLSKEEFSKRMFEFSKMKGHSFSIDFYGKIYDFADFIEREAASSRFHEDAKFSVRNAQRLTQKIISKNHNEKEFFAAMSVEYINFLNCDNDNSEKLAQYKTNEDVVRYIKDIYDLYDFSEANEVKVDPTISLADFFKGDAQAKNAAKSAQTKQIDDLINNLGVL